MAIELDRRLLRASPNVRVMIRAGKASQIYAYSSRSLIEHPTLVSERQKNIEVESH